jgi:hypothetical protein
MASSIQLAQQVQIACDASHLNSHLKGIQMKTALTILAFAAAGLAQAQTSASVTGKWKIHTVMVQESDSTCTFTQKDTVLTGACEGDNGKFDVSGKVDGNKVTWSYKTDYNGSPLTVSYEGKLDSDSKMTGAAHVAEMSLDGDFTAVKDTNSSAK